MRRSPALVGRALCRAASPAAPSDTGAALLGVTDMGACDTGAGVESIGTRGAGAVGWAADAPGEPGPA